MNDNSKASPQIGDMIQVDRLLHQHVGIYVGRRTCYIGHALCVGDVVHNDKSGGVILSWFTEFAGGSNVFLHKAATGNHLDREAIAQRALGLLGRKFDLLTFNCEHAAHFAQASKAESPQLQRAAILGAAVLGLFLLTRKG